MAGGVATDTPGVLQLGICLGVRPAAAMARPIALLDMLASDPRLGCRIGVNV